ncbi:MAG: glycerophosphodiester phosphodiesterase family protein [Lachnospiraceae bacterium]|nr:glycerophosphodiester phosphodiesterase family protein [Lachnospiraceae bacterium]
MWLKVLIIAFVIILLLYLWLIKPGIADRPDIASLMGHYYAHRGLHDNETDAPENSMNAFKKAIDAGYGIELDVQLTKDRIPVVFHDETLKRVCGVDGRVRDYTYEELQQFRLCRSDERIPLFSDFLKLVDGKVPLIIEIKIHENVDTVCSIADELIKEYRGTYCIESFHTMAVQWYRKHRPEVIRGQLSTDFSKPGKRESWYLCMVHYLLGNVMGRPDFIAYDHLHKNNISRRLCRYLFGALSVAWTIKSQKELDACKKDFDLFIFEGFVPEEKQA